MNSAKVSDYKLTEQDKNDALFAHRHGRSHTNIQLITAVRQLKRDSDSKITWFCNCCLTSVWEMWCQVNDIGTAMGMHLS